MHALSSHNPRAKAHAILPGHLDHSSILRLFVVVGLVEPDDPFCGPRCRWSHFLLPPSLSPSLRPSSVSLPAARRTWRGDRFGLLQTDVVSDGAATLTAAAAAKERASETCFHSAVKASSHSHRSSAQVCPALGFLDEYVEAFALLSKAFDAHEPKRGEFLRRLPPWKSLRPFS